MTHALEKENGKEVYGSEECAQGNAADAFLRVLHELGQALIFLIEEKW